MAGACLQFGGGVLEEVRLQHGEERWWNVDRVAQRHDRFSPPPANSLTLRVLHQLAGSPRARWGEVEGVDFAVAAAARAVIRRT